MKIMVMGTGGVGGYYGGLLAQQGNEVTFIARGAHLYALRHEGLKVKSVHGDFHVHPVRATDDPDLSELVESFNQMVDALQARIQREARFAADVSHELRTPVTTLTTSLALLERARNLDPQTERAVHLMADELARFRRALEDLLALGRLESGIDDAALMVTESHELVRQALVASGRPVGLAAPGAGLRGAGPPVLTGPGGPGAPTASHGRARRPRRRRAARRARPGRRAPTTARRRRAPAPSTGRGRRSR